MVCFFSEYGICRGEAETVNVQINVPRTPAVQNGHGICKTPSMEVICGRYVENELYGEWWNKAGGGVEGRIVGGNYWKYGNYWRYVRYVRYRRYARYCIVLYGFVLS